MAGRVRHHPFAAQGPADRHHAAGEPLGEQDQLRLEIPALDREHRSATADPGLDLIGDQHPAVALAERREALPEPGRRDHDPALAEDRLDQHAGDLLGVDLVAQQHLLEVVDVDGVVVGPRALVERRAEAVRVGREDESGDVLGGVRGHLREVCRSGGGQVRGLAVVLAEEAEDHRPPGRLAGELHRALDHLGAGDPARGPGDVRRRQLDQALRELDRRRAADVVGDLEAVVVHRVDRLLERRRGHRPERVRSPGRDVVDEGVPVDVLDQPVGLALDVERHRLVLAVRAVHDRVVARHELGAARPREGGPHAWELDIATQLGAHARSSPTWIVVSRP